MFFSEISHRQSRTHFLRRDFSRSGKGGVFFSEISHRQSRTHFFATRLFVIGQGWRVFFRDFTSAVTDAFFCDGTFRNRAREAPLQGRNPVQGQSPLFFGAEVSSAGEKKDAAFFRRSERKKIPISPVKRRQPLDNRLLFCYTV